MSKKSKTEAPEVPAAETPVDKRAARIRHMEARKAALIEAGELPSHEQDAPAGYGQPIEQPAAEEMKIDGKGGKK